jgi:hypothetical protein
MSLCVSQWWLYFLFNEFSGSTPCHTVFFQFPICTEQHLTTTNRHKTEVHTTYMSFAMVSNLAWSHEVSGSILAVPTFSILFYTEQHLSTTNTNKTIFSSDLLNYFNGKWFSLVSWGVQVSIPWPFICTSGLIPCCTYFFNFILYWTALDNY